MRNSVWFYSKLIESVDVGTFQNFLFEDLDPTRRIIYLIKKVYLYDIYTYRVVLT